MVNMAAILPLLKGEEMSDSCPTVKVKPWSKSQGDFVIINSEDFNPEIHELLDGESLAVAEAETAVQRALRLRREAEELLESMSDEERGELFASLDRDLREDKKAAPATSKPAKASKATEAPATPPSPPAADPANGWGNS